MQGSIKILDCTLRDGGQGLEATNNIGIATEMFTELDKQNIINNTRDAKIDIIEIGCMSSHSKNQEGFAIYNNIVDLSRTLPEDRGNQQLYTGLYIDPDTPLETIPKANENLVEGIRVILRYSQLQQSVDFCAALAEKGYKVFIQPMLTMRYTDDELKMLVSSANEMGAYALYFVDSFGYMTEADVDRIYRFYCTDLNSKIKIGFHAHNNMDNAFINAKYFLDKLTGRDRIVDSCVFGMGQGAGNLQTEILVNYMNEHYHTDYAFDKILDVCELVEKFRENDMRTWGYTPLRFIPAIHKTAYKYAIVMRTEYNMSLKAINEILKNMPDELRHRYTAENLKSILG